MTKFVRAMFARREKKTYGFDLKKKVCNMKQIPCYPIHEKLFWELFVPIVRQHSTLRVQHRRARKTTSSDLPLPKTDISVLFCFCLFLLSPFLRRPDFPGTRPRTWVVDMDTSLLLRFGTLFFPLRLRPVPPSASLSVCRRHAYMLGLWEDAHFSTFVLWRSCLVSGQGLFLAVVTDLWVLALTHWSTSDRAPSCIPITVRPCVLCASLCYPIRGDMVWPTGVLSWVKTVRLLDSGMDALLTMCHFLHSRFFAAGVYWDLLRLVHADGVYVQVWRGLVKREDS